MTPTWFSVSCGTCRVLMLSCQFGSFNSKMQQGFAPFLSRWALQEASGTCIRLLNGMMVQFSMQFS